MEFDYSTLRTLRKTHLILSVEEITDMVKVFFPSSGNEARFVDRINSHHVYVPNLRLEQERISFTHVRWAVNTILTNA